jgi:hypothetical protein
MPSGHEEGQLYLFTYYHEVIKESGGAAGTGERRGIYRVLVGKPEGKNDLEDPGVDGRKIVRWIFRKRDMGVWTRSSWLRLGTGGGRLCVR